MIENILCLTALIGAVVFVVSYCVGMYDLYTLDYISDRSIKMQCVLSLSFVVIGASLISLAFIRQSAL